VLGAIGAAPATGEFRMDFGIAIYLRDGMPLVVVGARAVRLPGDRRPAAPNRVDRRAANKLGAAGSQGLRDTLAHWLVLRCSGLGCIVGAIPGLGGSVVDWIAYGHVVQTSRTSPKFGKGDIRGVIAPESANNAKEGGALVPTLLFGIPGSGSMAIFLAGMVLIGIEPGPSMVGATSTLTYTIVWSLALANVLGAGSASARGRDRAADHHPLHADRAVHDHGDLLRRVPGDATSRISPTSGRAARGSAVLGI
jgi:putative tricarboxylic transport membrane protein